jgi:hypothetical protein
LPHLFAGEFAAAASLITQLESVTEATGSSIAPYAPLVLAALRGWETEAARLIEAGMKEAERGEQGAWLTWALWATAVLHNSLGRYEQALAAAEQASQGSRVLAPANWAVVELIEAATRRLGSLPGRSLLPAAMLQDLTGAWQASAQVDTDLARWAEGKIARGCHRNSRSDARLRASYAPEGQATAASTRSPASGPRSPDDTASPPTSRTSSKRPGTFPRGQPPRDVT